MSFSTPLAELELQLLPLQPPLEFAILAFWIVAYDSPKACVDPHHIERVSTCACGGLRSRGGGAHI